MPQMELTSEEKDLLIEVLDDIISDMRMELADTDGAKFKDELRKRKDTLYRILESLKKS